MNIVAQRLGGANSLTTETQNFKQAGGRYPAWGSSGPVHATGLASYTSA